MIFKFTLTTSRIFFCPVAEVLKRTRNPYLEYILLNLIVKSCRETLRPWPYRFQKPCVACTEAAGSMAGAFSSQAGGCWASLLIYIWGAWLKLGEELLISASSLHGKNVDAVCRNRSIECRRFSRVFIFIAMLIISEQVVFTSSLSCTDINCSVLSAI